ncbi:hypothetical protein [Leisingera thetidis]|uniref:hypothetical protein n=1 Tax=Leisingera thetidis TaxID=2930199 RepID=UPI0021F7008C|nr:hypothetical protein [Leisingera thetidis]
MSLDKKPPQIPPPEIFFLSGRTFAMLAFPAHFAQRAGISIALKSLQLCRALLPAFCGAKTPLAASAKDSPNSASPAPFLALKGAQSQPLGTFTDAGTRHHA